MRLRTRVFRVLRYINGFLGMICAPFKKGSSEIVILMYHRVIDDVNKGLAVKRDMFLWQMDYLKRKGFKVISMSEACDKITSNSIDGKYIVLTFDDGYEDYYYNAFPILEKYCFPSIVYVVPGYMESGKVFPWDRDLCESCLMKWEQLQNLGKSGLVEFGSHTLNHIELNRLSGSRLRHEIEGSKKILEDKLSRRIIHFSYPRGVYSREAEKIIGENYSTGVLIFNGEEANKKLTSGGLLRLKRIAVQNSDGRFMFMARVCGWLKLEEWIRKRMGIN